MRFNRSLADSRSESESAFMVSRSGTGNLGLALLALRKHLTGSFLLSWAALRTEILRSPVSTGGWTFCDRGGTVGMGARGALGAAVTVRCP